MSLTKKMILLSTSLTLFGQGVFADEADNPSIQITKAANPVEESTIPVIDMSDLHNVLKRNHCIKTVSLALQELGMFAIINTGINKEISSQAFDVSKEFFAQNDDVKKRYVVEDAMQLRGYKSVGKELSEAGPDLKESFHVGPMGTTEKLTELGYIENVWPEEVPVRKGLSRLYSTLDACSLSVRKLISLSLGEDEAFLTRMTRDGDNTLRVVHYPKVEGTEAPDVWAHEHTDENLITLAPIASSEGLQVKLRNHKWIPVEVPEGAIIVNAGDMLENLTNGYFRSAPHRVVVQDQQDDRYAMVFYINSTPDQHVNPIASCVSVTGGKVVYPAATQREIHLERMARTGEATPEMLKELAESGIIERMIDAKNPNIKTLKVLKDNGLASPKVISIIDRIEARENAKNEISDSDETMS